MNRLLVFSLCLAAGLASAGEPAAAPLSFGIAQPYGDAHARKARAQLEPFLSKALGSKVTVAVYGSGEVLGEALVAGKVDLAWITPLAFVLAAKKNAEVVAVSKAVREGGGIYYRSALVVKAGSGFKTLDDLAGKRVAWVSKSSASGYL